MSGRIPWSSMCTCAAVVCFVLRVQVSGTSVPKIVAGSIAHVCRAGSAPSIMATGDVAINQVFDVSIKDFGMSVCAFVEGRPSPLNIYPLAPTRLSSPSQWLDVTSKMMMYAFALWPCMLFPPQPQLDVHVSKRHVPTAYVCRHSP